MTDNEIARLNEVAETLKKTFEEGGVIALNRLFIHNWSNVMEYNNGKPASICIEDMDVAVWNDGLMFSAIEECVNIKLDEELTNAIMHASFDIPSNIDKYPRLFVEPNTISEKDMEVLCTTWDWFINCTTVDITAENYIKWMREEGLMDRDFFDLGMDYPEFEHFLEYTGFTDRFEDFLNKEIKDLNASIYAILLPAIRQVADAIRIYWEDY